MLRADEDGRKPSLHNKFLLYIFKCKWNREIGHLLTKISKVKYKVKCNVRLNIKMK